MRPGRWVLVLVLLVGPLAVLPARAASAATPPSVLMVGDSTMRGMGAGAQDVIGAEYDLTFDSGSCRRLIVASCKPIPNALDVIRAHPGQDVIVVMTGYNDWTIGAAVDAIMAGAAGQGALVVWLTYRTDIVEGAQKPIAIGEVFRAHNAELAEKAAQYADLLVLDWDGYSAGRDDWFAWDGFHLSTAGGYALAGFLKGTLDGLGLVRCQPDAAGGTPVPGPAPLAPTAAPPAGLALGGGRRLIDTRAGDGDAVEAPVGGGLALTVPLAASGALPSGATSALVNVAAVDPCGAGFLTVYDCGAVPLASNVNFTRRHTVANLVVARLDTAGELCVYASAQTDVVVDLVGTLAPDGWRYNGVGPARLVDTREAAGAALGNVGRLAPMVPLALPVRGVAGVPTEASAVVLNVTAVDPAEPGYLTAYGCGPVPWVSSLNFVPGHDVANLALVPLAADGSACLVTNARPHVVVDVVGWLGATGSRLAVATPRRLVDTRDAGWDPAAADEPGRVVSVPVDGGRLLNVTAVDPRAPGFLTAYPCGALPLVSTLNYWAGQDVPNLAPVAPGADGRGCVYLQQPGHVVVDELATFTP